MLGETLFQVTILKSITSIENRAFYECKKLSTIIYEGTISEWNAIEKGEDCFKEINESARVICIDGEVTP